MAAIESFIGDGHTENGYIAELPRVHGALRFAFRPYQQEEVTRHLEASRKLKADEQDVKAAELVAARLESWSLTYKGEPVPITAANVRRLKRPLLLRLAAIVIWSEQPDEDPTAAPEDQADQAAIAKEAAASGLPFRPGA